MPASAPDPYPSRRVAAPQLLPRQDPVLHGGPDAPGPLARDELLAFERDGWLLRRGVFSAAEAAALADEVERLAGIADETRISEPDAPAVRSLFAIHRGDGPLARAQRDRRVAGLARQILADEVAFHQSRVNRKPAFDGREFSWHSDFETWHVEDGLPAMRVLSAMVMLTPNTAANGPLLVIPGSHIVFVSCVGEAPPDHHRTSLRRQQYGVPDRASLTALASGRGVEAALGGPGDVVIFDGNLLHASGGNLSPLPRCNLFAVYNAVGNAPGRPYGGGSPRPAHVAEPAPQPAAGSP